MNKRILRNRSALTRRAFGAGCVVSAAAGFPPSARAEAAPKSLGALAAEKGILFGASFAVHELDAAYGADYARIYEHDARILTSELEFKMAALRPASGNLDFFDADKLVDFAEKRQMKVRAHTLIWNDDLPDWIKGLAKDDAASLLDVHIGSVISRYQDRVAIWDVVNEPIGPWDKLPGNLRGGPYYAALGEGYILRAFEQARKVAPAATLVLNEAQTETDDANGATFRASLLALLKRLKDQDAPIDAIGLQSHLKADARYDLDAFTQYVGEIASLGYDIHITELDVNDTGIAGDIATRDAKVATLYERYLSAMLKLPAVKVVQLWQLSDRTSWMRDPALIPRIRLRSQARPLPYDDAFKKKPAWDAVARALSQAAAR